MWLILDGERASMADMLASLTEAQWAKPSLCTGWTVRDVAAHLTLGPQTTVSRAVVEIVRARGSFNRMVDRTARRHAARPVDQLVAELRDTVGSRRLAPGQKLADALMDVLVHGQDIAVPSASAIRCRRRGSGLRGAPVANRVPVSRPQDATRVAAACHRHRLGRRRWRRNHRIHRRNPAAARRTHRHPAPTHRPRRGAPRRTTSTASAHH